MRVLKSLRTQLCQWPVVLLAVFGGAPAHAGLFEDEDARRAILELRQQRTQDGDALTAKLAALNAQIDVLKRSLLDMNAQIELVRSDLAKERGQNEVLARDLADVQRRQKDLQQAFEEKSRKLEPVSVSLDGKSFKAEPDEKRIFEDNLARLRSQDFVGAAASINGFLVRYPATGYRESALYWLGNAYYGASQFGDAIGAFKQLITLAPDHARSSEALLSIANCYSELKDAKQLRKTLEDVIKQYPQSEAAQAAKDRLAATAPLSAPAAPSASAASEAPAASGKGKAHKK